MNNDLILDNKISKEDFKRYFSECNKIAWIFYSQQNLLESFEFKKKQIYEYFVDIESTKENDVDIDPLALYEYLLTNTNLSLEELERKEILLHQFDDEFASDPLEKETIVDGKLVGDEARQYFIKKLYDENKKNNTNFEYLDFQSFGYGESIFKTKAVLENKPNIKFLFEPTFEFANSKLKVRCDVLINNGHKRVEIIEVKASTSIKKEHFYDLFYQWFVLTRMGYVVENISICLVNKNYLRGAGIIDKDLIEAELQTIKIDFEQDINIPFLKTNILNTKEELDIEDDINYDQLFLISNFYKSKITFLEMFLNIEKSVNLNELLIQISKQINNKEILKNETCGNYKIDYKNKIITIQNKFCQHVVNFFDKQKYNIFDLPRFKTKAAEIYRLKNIVYFDQIKLPILDEEWLNLKNKPYFNQTEKNIIEITKNFIVNNMQKNYSKILDMTRYDDLLEILKDYFKFPIYMYDFETAKWAIPRFNNSFSYQQIPFQYSIHVLADENFDFNNQDTIKHFNFISDTLTDPRLDFLKKFIVDCFKYGPGIYVAYNKSFEKSVLKYLMYIFPDYKKPLLWIYQHTIDLMDFFSKKEKKWLIYDPEFRGSASIKATQPALNNFLNYKDLTINKGDKASTIFRQFIDEKISKEFWDGIIKTDMLKYCDRDTLAMVVVLQKIIEIVNYVDPTFKAKIDKLIGDNGYV